MKYQFNVCLNKGTDKERWVPVRVSGAKEPYTYATRREAEDMARMCYGNDPDIVKVVEIDDE